MSRIYALAVLGGIPAVLVLLTAGCSELADRLERPENNCLGCHADQEILETTAEPDTVRGKNRKARGEVARYPRWRCGRRF